MTDQAIDLGELRDSIRPVLAASGSAIESIPGESGRPMDRDLWREMADLGWLSLTLPEAYGGLGLGMAHTGVLYEELGRVVAATPAMSTLIAAQAIQRWGDEPLKRRVLSAIAGGELCAAVQFPYAADIRMEAGKATGAADHVLFGADADILLLPVRLSKDETALAVIPKEADGVSAEDRPLIDLTRRMARIEFNNVAIANESLLRPDSAGWAQLWNHAAIALACDSIGGSDALFAQTIDYLCVREQFGRPIGSFQALKHRAASWKVQLEAASALVRQASASYDHEESSKIASSAKYYATDLYSGLCGDAVQLHGGIGFTWEHPCHLFLKRAALNQQICGASSAHKDRIARLAFGAEARSGDALSF